MVKMYTNEEKVLGEILKNARLRQNLSQEKLASLTGLSVQSISNAERGVHSPNFSSVIKILRAVKMPIDDFFSNFLDEKSSFEKDKIIIDINKILNSMNITSLMIVREHCRTLSTYLGTKTSDSK